MPRLSFLWHLHQPQYRTADGRVHAPWVLLHAAGEYLTLAHSIRGFGLAGQVLNLTPTFLEQLVAYREGRADDPLLTALRTPSRELSADGRHELLRWAFLLHPNQMSPWPRLAELAARARGAAGDELLRRFTAQDITDLQVLLVLAYAHPNFHWEPEIRETARRGAEFSDASRREAVAWLERCPGKLLELYLELATRPGVEIATSPFAHPIVPLLIDTRIVTESWAPHPAPAVPAFSAPEDAETHLRRGLAFARELGFDPVGCWPPEGSVSEAAVELYGAHDVRWLTTDEGILAASLTRPLSGETGVGPELFSPWQLPSGGPKLFFRHRGFSDFIGFEAARYPDEGHAARDLVANLRHVARGLPHDSGILIALDGENPWTSFPSGGRHFLAALAEELSRGAELVPCTLAERAESEPARVIEHLHPGSWIGGVFATWIGHPEKNRGWELLSQLREAGAWRGGDSWLAAEGSDWWWWLGDDNPTLLAPLYDELFRAHMRDACVLAGIKPTADLSAPIRSASVRLQVPLSTKWPTPVLDGRTTSYFEWAVAAWVDAPETSEHLARVAVRNDGSWLWLRVDGRDEAPVPLVVTLVGNGGRRAWTLPEDLPDHCAVDTCLEVRLPLPEGDPLLAVELDGERLPVEGFWQLEVVEVDEE